MQTKKSISFVQDLAQCVEMDNGPHGQHGLVVPRHVDLMAYKQKPELAIIHLLPAAVMHALGHRQIERAVD
jgi:hypothetical protein